MVLDDEALREAASHRGLKLIKSRKRKPGTGDYGKFGLTDATGKALLGVVDEGLSASAEDIAAYLRRGDASSWSDSAISTPDRPRSKPSSKPDEEVVESAIAPRPQHSGGQKPSSARTSPKAEARAAPPRQRDEASAKARGRRAEAPLEPEPEPPPSSLAIRSARKTDAAAIRELLSGASTPSLAVVEKRIAQAARLSEPVLVATRSEVVAVLDWYAVPDLMGAIGRLARIIVAEDERRHGIGRALVEAFLVAATKRECHLVEAMSLIDVRNANAFLRAVGFEEASYRFVRVVADTE